MSHCLLIGAGGFIGRALAAELRNVTPVVGMDLMPQPAQLSWMDWITGSINDPTLVASAVSNAKAVIFLANASLPGSSQTNFTNEVTAHVAGTLQVAEICQNLGVERFIFASSGGTVYGYDSPEGGLVETDSTMPRNGYGASKLAIEHYLRLIHEAGRMRTLSLRLSNPYGEGQRALRAQGIVAAAMQHAMAGTTLPIWGDGSVERDFIYISDVARAFAAALPYSGSSCVINIGSGQATSVNQIVAEVRAATGRPLAVDYQPDRKIDVGRSLLNIKKAADELGWAPTVTLNEGMQRTASWWAEISPQSQG